MSITKELRELARRKTFTWGTELNAIADRIDAEHESEINIAAQLLADAEKDRDFNYADWQDCKQKVLQHNITIDELDAEIERLKDELAHCIELPNDADGEYIHIGDELRDDWNEQNQGEVERLMLDHNGWWLRLNNSCERFYVHEFHEWRHRHHHEPTVEDVLREFLGEMQANESDPHRTLAEFAAKLRLAGDEE